MLTKGFRQKHILFGFILITTIILLGSAGAFASVTSDVEEHWAGDVISEWMDSSLATGYLDGTFKPNKSITRAEFITMVNRAMGYTDKADIYFPDVKKEIWYYDEIARAVEAGYIQGDADGTMSPNREISRQEVSIILFRLLELDEEKEKRPIDSFNDYEDIASWSKEEVNAVVEAGYIEGYPDKTFNPSRATTRAETVVILDRAVGKLYNEAGVFGASEEVIVIDGNTTVSVSDVTLKNMIINGDLLLTAGIGDGDAYLMNITVNGRTVIKGGGEDSIVIDDSTLNEVVVNKKNGKVRVAAQGNTIIQIVKVKNGAKLELNVLTDESTGITTVFIRENEEVELSGDFGSVSIESEGAKVSLVSGSIENLKISETASNANISVSENTAITKMEINALTSVTGQGNIGTALIGEGAENSSFEKEPENTQRSNQTGNVEEAEKQDTSLDDSSSSSGTTGGGGGTRPTVSLNSINDLVISPDATMEIDVTTNAASVAASSTNTDVVTVTVDNNKLILTAEGSGTAEIIVIGTRSRYNDRTRAFTVIVPTLLTGFTTSVPANVVADEDFYVTVTNAVYENTSLEGTYQVKIDSNKDGQRYNGPVTFTEGNAEIGIYLLTIGEHELSVEIPYLSVTSKVYIEVEEEIIPVNALNVNPETMTLTAGGPTGTLTATITPINATNKSVTWTSSDEGVVTIDGGIVTPIAEGSAAITVTTEDGNFMATCIVTVDPAPNQEQDAPAGLAVVAPSRFEESDGKITGVDDSMEYKLSTDTEWTPVIGIEIIGLSAGTYLVRYVERSGYNAGAAVEVAVPDGEKSSNLSLSVFTIGGMDAIGLEGMAIGFPPDGNYNGANLYVDDFTDFYGIVVETNDPKAIVNKIFLNNIEVEDSATVSINENDRILVWVTAENGFEQIYSVYARAVPTYGIELSAANPTNLGTVPFGYSSQTPANVTIIRTGTGNITNLAVALSGTNGDSFTVTQLTATTLDENTSSTTFTIVPIDGLSVGTYTANVDVTAENEVSESFVVNFEVEAPRYNITTNIIGGTATITTEPVGEAEEGADITVSITDIEAGKHFKSITITDVESGTVETTEETAGESYTFTMPAKAVTIDVEIKDITVTGISVKTPPTKAAYKDGENLNLSGLVVTLTKSDESTQDVALTDFEAEGITTIPVNGEVLIYDITEVLINHTTGDVSTTQPITVNANPSAVDDTATVNEDDSVLINVLDNDTDLDGDTLSIASFTQGSHGSVNQDGNTLRYRPAANYNGADSFEYGISDDNGGTATGIVSITINPVNDLPVAIDDNVEVNEDGTILIDVFVNDYDVDGDTLSTTTEYTQGSNGVVSKEGDSLRYDPNADYNGADSFTYDISDGNGGTATATVNVTINPINDQPVALNDTVEVDANGSVVVDVLANDYDIDGDTLTITGVTQGMNGATNVNDERTIIIYTPNAGYTGADSFMYEISDGNGGIATATVNVTVVPVPVTGVSLLAGPEIYMEKGQTLQMEAVIQPSNATNQAVAWSSDPNHYDTATIEANGSVTAHSVGSTTITVTTDEGSFEDSVILSVRITPTSVAIQEEDQTIAVDETAQLTAVVLPADASDPSLVWFSDNETIASVDLATGLVTGKSVGVTTIRAETALGGIVDTVTITVE